MGLRENVSERWGQSWSTLWMREEKQTNKLLLLFLFPPAPSSFPHTTQPLKMLLQTPVECLCFRFGFWMLFERVCKLVFPFPDALGRLMALLFSMCV